jgi:CPA2 family monovalent cation:H+ antiporter-2
MKISPVLGFLLCGILMGPHGLASWFDMERFPSIEDSKIIESFSELGIIFLMFMIGLKLSLNELWRMRKHILGLGSCQIILTAAAVAMIARYFGNTLEMSILLGACFALSSTAVVMQLLEEKHASNEPVGKLSFSILLMQDLAVVPILALLTAYTGKTDENIFLLTAEALALAAAAIVGIYFVGMRVLRPLLHHINPGKRREWLMSFVLFIAIGAAYLTELAGLSSALGAFLAGLLLAETEYKSDIQTVIAPVRNLLMGVFFLSVGMMINGSLLMEKAALILASVAGIGLLKAGILLGLCLMFGVEKKTAMETSILLGQSGEFVFVIVTIALANGMMQAVDAQFFMLVTAMSLLVTPFVAAIAPNVAKKLAPLMTRGTNRRDTIHDKKTTKEKIK